jgi:hypothetical protein
MVNILASVFIILVLLILRYFLGISSVWGSSVRIYGYDRLLARYSYPASWEGESFFFKNLYLEGRYYSTARLSMVVNDQAIYIHKTWDEDSAGVLIPWTEVDQIKKFKSANSFGLSLSIGKPQIAKIYLPGEAVLRIRKYLPAHRSAPGAGK